LTKIIKYTHIVILLHL